MHSQSLLPVFLLVLSILSSIPISATQISVRDRCPNTCSSEASAIFSSCAPLATYGCTIATCGKDRVRCTMREEGPTFFLPSDIISVKNAELEKPDSFPISLSDLSLKLDVYLLVDTTGSMDSIIRSIRKEYPKLISALEAAHADVAFGIGQFKDETELEDGFRNMQPITKSPVALLEALASLRARGGGDGPEANLVALYKLAVDGAIRWRRNSRRVVIYVADFVGHEPTCVEGLPRLDRARVAKALVKHGISVIALSYPKRSLDRATTPYLCKGRRGRVGRGQGSFLTNATGGVYLSDRSVSFDTATVLTAVENILLRVDVRSDTCLRYADTYFYPELPASIDDDMHIVYNVTLRKGACTNDKFACKVDFDVGGVESLTMTLRYSDVLGC